MDYKEKYEKALAKAKEQYNYPAMASSMGILEDLFPELKENEDEKIRGAIIDHLKDNNLTEWAAWLEKQGEQKLAWSEEDEDYYDAIIAKLEVTQDDALLTDNQMRFLKSLKDRVQPQPQYEWSEEDEAKLKSILFHVEDVENKDVINWLKSLKDRYTWKPSDEQMEALKQAKTDACGKPYFNALASLYVNLKGY